MDPAHYPTDPEAPGPASPQELVRHLRGYEGVLPDAVRRPLVAAGAPLVPALIALVEDALADDQTDLGSAPCHRPPRYPRRCPGHPRVAPLPRP